MSRNRWFVLLLTVLAVFAVTGAALADGPVDGRAGRAEIRFLEGMIDHHQMALDMANHCLAQASTDEVRALCEAVIAAQTPEIEQMQGWLRDWYGIEYQPMSMLGVSTEHDAPAADHSQHQQGTAAATDHSQHQQQGTAAPAAAASGMCSMMGGEGCAMMGDGGMSGMMDMMGDGGMSMMGGDMLPIMQMQMMMMQMQMMQMMMAHMGMGGMQGMSGMGMGMMGEGGMSGMGMMDGMSGMPGMSGMSGRGGSDNPAMQQNAADALAQTAPADHSAHHPAAESTPEATPEAGAMPGMDMSGSAATVTDPAMSMGMLAGLDRLTGVDYDLAWLEAMIEHHDGALHMAGRVQMWAQHPELLALAENIISAQTAEIEQMEALIAQLSA